MAGNGGSRRSGRCFSKAITTDFGSRERTIFTTAAAPACLNGCTFSAESDCGHGPDRCELQIRGFGQGYKLCHSIRATKTPSFFSSGSFDLVFH